ncbi:MAG: hypothetical protein ACE14V_05870 [bacterium]
MTLLAQKLFRNQQQIKSLAAAGPDFMLAGSFLMVWFFPYALGEDTIKYFIVLMTLEFIVIHSTLFLTVLSITVTPLSKKLVYFGAVVLFYSLFAGALSLMFGSIWPLISFWTLTLIKYPGLIFLKSFSREFFWSIISWLVMTLTYFGGVFVTMILPIPQFGLTDAVIKQLNLPGGGAWIEETYRLVAFGVIYFTTLGLYELFISLKFTGKETKEDTGFAVD